MPFAMGVVHLGNDARHCASGGDAPKDAEWIEGVAENARVRKHHDAVR